MQAAERDYDLNRAAELKYGTLLQLQRQLKEAEEKLAEKVRLTGYTLTLWLRLTLCVRGLPFAWPVSSA